MKIKKTQIAESVVENTPEAILVEEVITEDTLENAVKKEAEDGVYVDEDSMEAALDMAYKANMRKKKTEQRGGRANGFVNVLLTGPAGVGKTSRVKSWARSKNLFLVEEDAKGMDASDIGGAVAPDKETGTKAIKLGTTQFDALDTGGEEGSYAVLFLDELNRAPADVRGSLLTLINDHVVPDPTQPNHMRYLKKFLFTIAAINPGGGDYNVDTLDAAERSRFYIVEVTADPRSLLQHLTKVYDEEIAERDVNDPDDAEEIHEFEGRKALAKKLLSSPNFFFDTSEDEEQADEDQTNILNPRSFTQLLDMCDGTKKSLLFHWNRMVNPKKKGMAESILASYKDVENKANKVFDDKRFNKNLDRAEKEEKPANNTPTAEAEPEEEEDASIFKQKEESAWDKLKGFNF